MSCTTILVGKKASYDGSTIIARNEDSSSTEFCPKKFLFVSAKDQPKKYRSVLSHVEIDLPEHPLSYTVMPNADLKEGIWGAAGVNEKNIAMTATETLTTNVRVVGADPLVELVEQKGKEGDPDFQKEIPGGIGEEDFVTLILPYISSAREGVLRMGALLEKYGTYEMNGVAFQDADEIWWLETIGGHHWMARRVPDEVYVTMPNQLGLDQFHFDDALGMGKNYLCSKDLKEFVEKNHLDLGLEGNFNPRLAFGSHDDADHVYNTPRSWVIQRALNPRTSRWDGPDADFSPMDDDIPWCQIPERKITIEEIKDLLSNHYQGTPYDPYENEKTPFRPIGVNRTSHLAVIQIRPDLPESYRALEWVAYGSNVYNALVPFFTNITKTPEYLAYTPEKATTESFYWANRIVAALADPFFHETAAQVERYQFSLQSKARRLIQEAEEEMKKTPDQEKIQALCEKANQKIADMAKEETTKYLDEVLDVVSFKMKNAFSRSDH